MPVSDDVCRASPMRSSLEVSPSFASCCDGEEELALSEEPFLAAGIGGLLH